MTKLPSMNVNELLDRVLAKRSWTQSVLAHEMNIGPHAISRWRSGGGIHKVHLDELKRLDADDPEPIIQPEKTPDSIGIPFKVKIPRSSLRVTLDKNGDINIEGMMLALLNKEA